MSIGLGEDVKLQPHINIKTIVMSLKYRSDIDGLRALAVLLVVFYHAKFPVSGGFVGVDVFFVISGFLITSIINKEINSHTFTFSSFYKRRIKRLLPAYLFMLSVVTIYCFIYLMPDDLVSYIKSLTYSLFGISNFYFFIHTNYFESSVSEPLLHTWSLSVEEQFYVVFPFILIVLRKFSSSRTVSLLALLVIFIASIISSHYYAINSKNMAYMLLPFRFFELMTGALLAIYFDKINNIFRSPNFSGVLGLMLILSSAFMIDSESIFPGFTALPVCLGSALLLTSNGGFVNKVLSLRPIVYIGKTSYSLYLWHWPIIALLEYRGIEITTSVGLIVVLASFVTASLSLHLIETPARNVKIDFKKTLSFMYAIPVMAFTGMAYAIVSNSGYPSRMDGIAKELDKVNFANEVRSQCMEKMKVGNVDECYLGVKKPQVDGIMIGDSFGNSYSGFVNILAKDAGLMIHDTMKSATPSIPGIFVTDVRNKIPNELAQKIVVYTTKRAEFAETHKIAILSDIWGQYNNNNKIYRVFDKNWVDQSKNAIELRYAFIEKLIKNGVTVVIITRPFSGIGTEGVNRLRTMKMKHENIDAYNFKFDGDRYSRVEYQLKKKYQQIILIDPNDVLCDQNGDCKASVNDTILYRPDGAHINYPASEVLGREYINKLGNPLKGLLN